MEDNNNAAGAPADVAGVATAPTGSTPVPPIPTTAPRPAQTVKEPDPADIGASLSRGSAAQAPKGDEPESAQPLPFDISQLRPEQLQMLKGMLNATPDRATTKKSNPIVTLRRFITVSAEGRESARLITFFKNAYNTWVHDDQANTNKEVVMIPVHFLGDADGKFVNIPYRDFINSEQVRCEVLSTRTKEGRIVEGEVLQKSTGRIIEREIKTLETWFTVKLPEGTDPASIEIEAIIANG